MSKVIATIRLAPGRVGFFDPLSRIHLTLGRPEAQVFSGTNCASLRRNVKAGVIRLVEGTLGEEVPPFKVVEVNGKYKLASNIAAEMAPVYAKEETVMKAEENKQDTEDTKKKIADAVAEVKGTKVEDGGDVKEAKAEAIKSDKAGDTENAGDENKEDKKAPAKKKAAAKKKATAED